MEHTVQVAAANVYMAIHKRSSMYRLLYKAYNITYLQFYIHNQSLFVHSTKLTGRWWIQPDSAQQSPIYIFFLYFAAVHHSLYTNMKTMWNEWAARHHRRCMCCAATTCGIYEYIESERTWAIATHNFEVCVTLLCAVWMCVVSIYKSRGFVLPSLRHHSSLFMHIKTLIKAPPGSWLTPDWLERNKLITICCTCV